jgi:hypothetical protein
MPPHDETKSEQQQITTSHKQSKSFPVVILGSALSGLAEAPLYPLDTLKTCWTANNAKYVPFSNFKSGWIINRLESGPTGSRVQLNYLAGKAYVNHYGSLLLGEDWDKSASKVGHRLMQGFKEGLAYKVFQRALVYGLGIYFVPQMQHWLTPKLPKTWDKRWSDVAIATFGGSLVGPIEAVVVLPVDTIKIIMQTNPNAGNALNIIMAQKLRLWNSLALTMPRNFIGAGVFWGMESFGKNFLIERTPGKDPTFFQELFTATLATSASIIGSNPLNVAKVRVQASEGNTTTVKELVRVFKEGAMMRGVIPNLLLAGPKKILSFAVAKHLVTKISNFFSPAPSPTNDASIPSSEPSLQPEPEYEVVLNESEPTPWESSFDVWAPPLPVGRSPFSLFHRSPAFSERVIEHDLSDTPRMGG